MNSAPPLQVAAAVIARDGRYLICRRKADAHMGGLWEFPGGKREAKESLPDCLRRELREELGIEITEPVRFQTVRHEYPEKSVELHFFRCTITAGAAQPLGCDELRWVTAGELASFDFPPADQSLIERLQDEI
ncbi:MAG TPA: 8-oxo-dGTP diphosphatase MutT [Nitrospirales bacterium]|jgi:mutator protein MutT